MYKDSELLHKLGKKNFCSHIWIDNITPSNQECLEIRLSFAFRCEWMWRRADMRNDWKVSKYAGLLHLSVSTGTVLEWRNKDLWGWGFSFLAFLFKLLSKTINWPQKLSTYGKRPIFVTPWPECTITDSLRELHCTIWFIWIDITK